MWFYGYERYELDCRFKIWSLTYSDFYCHTNKSLLLVYMTVCFRSKQENKATSAGVRKDSWFNPVN